MREDLETLIYGEKLLTFLYQRAAALATLESERQTLLQLAQRATQNVSILNYFYRQEYGIGYDPIIPEGSVPNSYRSLLMEIEAQEISSQLNYASRTNSQNSQLNAAMRSIADDKISKILTIQAILIAMNGTQIDNITNQIIHDNQSM